MDNATEVLLCRVLEQVQWFVESGVVEDIHYIRNELEKAVKKEEEGE